MTRKDKAFVRELIDELKIIYSVDYHDFTVRWHKEDEEGMTFASITYEDDYQRITLNIFPHFFKQDAHSQLKTLIHEFNHTKTLTLKDKFIGFINGTKCTTAKQVQDMDEKLTCGFENIINALMTNQLSYTQKRINDLVKNHEKNTTKKRNKTA